MVLDGEPHEAAHERGGGRRGQALEVVLANDADVAVEAREAQQGAQGVDEGRGPAKLAELDERELVDDQGRGDAEAHGVGEAVHLDAELGLRVREARDASVHAVKEHGEEDRDGGGREVGVHRLDDAVEGREERRRGEGVRQNVDALRLHRLETALPDGGEAFATRRVLLGHWNAFSFSLFHASPPRSRRLGRREESCAF